MVRNKLSAEVIEVIDGGEEHLRLGDFLDLVGIRSEWGSLFLIEGHHGNADGGEAGSGNKQTWERKPLPPCARSLADAGLAQGITGEVSAGDGCRCLSEQFPNGVIFPCGVILGWRGLVIHHGLWNWLPAGKLRKDFIKLRVYLPRGGCGGDLKSGSHARGKRLPATGR